MEVILEIVSHEVIPKPEDSESVEQQPVTSLSNWLTNDPDCKVRSFGMKNVYEILLSEYRVSCTFF